ncbi:DNA mismatch endonuclease (patch repair protein) [Caldalkalibacillus uzonensis]|uniref:DNA mismatch endonuclease (Patch repair protein) n=2 Tax=Caldalkalibacillus uzonensis TaxID=353224 RepID=A0ABU0CYB6_9BACI|nr:DNA mismatch endonuclease (patch repair protein) [Caldalkalibacillus uzonensis]
MSNIKNQNTKPELLIRSLLHKMGYRFRLHRKDLPGRPDLVLPKYKTVIFIHGCFWHQHPNCKKATIPKRNREFWLKKLTRNMERDQQVIEELESMGWNIIIIWECQVKKNIKEVMDKITGQLIKNVF